ncbi:hypothetical protein SPSYN_02735 [Sporotomaculum syntrophicum]|uniref:Uncharacterized protein n=1 Tax=Sporotomaculum syntrophicum TaxID=182264 RepID=A0A9D2WMT2_9FIRM|nr:hypothetical protein [Sporotomaculum syntrophicum]KAF1084083.1 hypothetical protein SPSYN_02735 [Sporotomaculum syntrophicum]
MTTTLVILLIAYVMISQIKRRHSCNLLENTIFRPPGDMDQPRVNYVSSNSEDRPLSGPWNRLPRSEDRPLSGPWDRVPQGGDRPVKGPWETSSQDEDGPSTAPWEHEGSAGAGGKPQPQCEYEEEVRTPQRQWEQTVIDLPLELSEQDNRPTALIKEVEMSAPRQGAKLNASNPLAAALRNKNALVGSIIIGEVLNSRGGKVKKRPGYAARVYSSACHTSEQDAKQ